MHQSQTNQNTAHTRGRTIGWAAQYDFVTRLLFLGKEGGIRQMTLDLAEIKPGEVVLDVGCGTGSLTIGAKTRAGPGGEVHGIDAASEMIEVAQRKATEREVDVSFQVGLIEDIPFPRNKFDLVLSSLMLHHLPHDLKREGFIEIGRVLKPGGRFLAVDLEPPSMGWLGGLATHIFGHAMVRSGLQDLATALEEAGFTEVESGGTQYRIIGFLRGKAG